jgi:hypothetical protein
LADRRGEGNGKPEPRAKKRLGEGSGLLARTPRQGWQVDHRNGIAGRVGALEAPGAREKPEAEDRLGAQSVGALDGVGACVDPRGCRLACALRSDGGDIGVRVGGIEHHLVDAARCDGDGARR